MPNPSEIRVRRATRAVEVDYDDGARFILPAELLRVLSPSAEVQGHSPAERKTVPGKQEVGLEAVEPIGHYAIRIRFDDGHDTGIYTWEYLYELGANQAERWAAYLAELESKGLSRAAPVRGRRSL